MQFIIYDTDAYLKSVYLNSSDLLNINLIDP